ncbi:MAG TPA: RNA polymerase sigma factor [Thermoanaerobaculia bacterium]
MERYDELSDSALMSRVAAGEENAIAPLVGRYGNALIAVLIRVTRDRTDADDIFQETWLRVIRSARSYDPLLPFRPWLFRIGWHLALSYVSRHRSDDKELDLAGEIAAPATPADHDLIAGERSARIRDSVRALPPKLAEAIFQRYFEELSEKEMADRLSVPAGTVKSRLHTALRRLALVLESENS